MSVSKILDNDGSNDTGCGLLGVHKPLHTCLALTLIMVHVEKAMAIELVCESAQQFRALMMILQYHKTLSYDAIPMPYRMCL